MSVCRLHLVRFLQCDLLRVGMTCTNAFNFSYCSKTLDERMKRLATGSITSTESETGEAGSRNSQDINVAKWDSMLNASANVQVTPEILTLPSQQEFDEWRSAVIDLLMQPDRGIKYHGSVCVSHVLFGCHTVLRNCLFVCRLTTRHWQSLSIKQDTCSILQASAKLVASPV